MPQPERLYVERRQLDRKALLRTGAAAMEPNTPPAPLVVHDAETGAPVLAVGRYPGDLQPPYRHAVRNYKIGKQRITRAHGTGNNSKAFGYLGPSEVMRRQGCRPCESALVMPAVHATIAGAASVLAAGLAELVPERAAADVATAQAIAPTWRMEGTQWTSGVVNFTSPIAYHTDANNLPTWSAMTVTRRGVRGGHLHVPEYDLVLACADGDIGYFAGWNLVHAVTPMRARADSYRITAVYYTVARMRGCTDDELAHSRAGRTEAETNWRSRQRAAGLLTEA